MIRYPPHLPALRIRNFRGIRSLELPKLARVTLLAGANAVGKTTVLEAVRIYASRGQALAINELIQSREEFLGVHDQNGNTVQLPDFASLFHDHEAFSTDDPARIEISAGPDTDQLTMELVIPNTEHRPQNALPSEITVPDLRICHRKDCYTLNATPVAHSLGLLGFGAGSAARWPKMQKLTHAALADALTGSIPAETVGPELPSNRDIARLWDSVVLTDSENLVIRALHLIPGLGLTGLAVIGDPSGHGRRVVAKLPASSRPIPLKRLGDGANRLLAIAVSLVKCSNGILLLDEVENGIHHAVQPDLWRLILDVAESADLQVIAATHSVDCIHGFAQAAAERSPAEAALFRLQSAAGGIHAVPYAEEDLSVAADQHIEVR